MDVEAPTGIVTLMFTDIQGSTELWERMRESFQPVLDRHNGLVREALAVWDGYEVKTEGDAFMVAFQDAAKALHCAVEIQRRLIAETWPDAVGELRIRIGLHSGEPLISTGSGGHPDYFGPPVNRAARVSNAAHGGQIFVSSAVADKVQANLPAGVELVNLGKHRLKGLEHPEVLFQVTDDTLPPREFPPPRTLNLIPHNLPADLSTFVGRETEVRDIRGLLLDAETRLLTLFGPGGVGKTRLALQVASECAPLFEDGTWFVELDQIRDPLAVPAAVADAAGIRIQPGQSAEEQLLAFARNRCMLIVSDNFEQVTAAAPFLDRLLRAAPRVKCLVTSRIALRLRGEQLYHVHPLPQPAADATVESLTGCDSAVLFIERAKEARSDWELTAANASVVAQLCQRLMGIPLCIELAAARVRAMSVEEILQRMSDQFKLLASRSPHLPDRHRTLRGIIDWSYELLPAEEQQLFLQLAVFAGEFTVAAAEEVTGNGDALDLIMELQSHSLLSRREIEGRSRFRMLDAVREYAAEKLRESGAEQYHKLAQCHAEYFTDFAEKHALSLRTPDEAALMAELAADLDNIHAALAWTARNDDHLCARLAASVNVLFVHRGYWEEAFRWANVGLLTARRTGDKQLIAKSLLNVASVHHDRNELEPAQVNADEALTLFIEINDTAGRASVLNLLGLIAQARGDKDAADRHFNKVTELREALGDRAGMAIALHNQAIALHETGLANQDKAMLDQAAHRYEQALELRRAIGDRRGIAETLCNLGVMAQDNGDYAKAREQFLECLDLWQALGDKLGLAMVLHNLGEVVEAEGRLELALILYSAAAAILGRIGSPLVATCEERLARIASAPALQPFAERTAAARRLPLDTVVDMARRGE